MCEGIWFWVCYAVISLAILGTIVKEAALDPKFEEKNVRTVTWSIIAIALALIWPVTLLAAGIIEWNKALKPRPRIK